MENIKFSKEMGTELLRKRKELGLLKDSVAKKAGIHVVYLDLIERGKKCVCLATFIKLANVLEIRLIDYEGFLIHKGDHS